MLQLLLYIKTLGLTILCACGKSWGSEVLIVKLNLAIYISLPVGANSTCHAFLV